MSTNIDFWKAVKSNLHLNIREQPSWLRQTNIAEMKYNFSLREVNLNLFLRQNTNQTKLRVNKTKTPTDA